MLDANWHAPQGNDSATLKDYVNNIVPGNLQCYWSPQGNWHDAHGDNKRMNWGKWHLQTMHGSDGKYHVRVCAKKQIAIAAFAVGDDVHPAEEAVVTALRGKVK